MSKTWYPMINYDKCVKCGACVGMCPHGVYNKEKAPRPIVVNPEDCVQGCKGCGSICPADAIAYFGDMLESAQGGCGCGCEDGSSEDGCGRVLPENGCGGDCDCGGNCCG